VPRLTAQAKLVSSCRSRWACQNQSWRLSVCRLSNWPILILWWLSCIVRTKICGPLCHGYINYNLQAVKEWFLPPW